MTLLETGVVYRSGYQFLGTVRRSSRAAFLSAKSYVKSYAANRGKLKSRSAKDHGAGV